MGLIDTLKKLNILRAGAVAGTYTNAKDRPMALQDDMFLGKPEPGAKKATLPPTAKGTNSGKQKQPSRAFLIVVCILAAIFMFLALTTTAAWFFILVWLIWVLYIWRAYAGKAPLPAISLTAILVLFCIVTFLLILVTQTGTGDVPSSSTSKSSSTKKLSAAECKTVYNKYNGKILQISSDGLQGTIAIKIDTANGCKLQGWYNVLLAYTIPQNPYKRDAGPSYHYIVLLRDANQTERTKYDGLGSLSPVYKNHTVLPEPFSDSVERAALYSQGVQATETRYFSWGYRIDTTFSEQRYQEILSSTKLEIVDGEPYINEKLDSTGGYKSYIWSVDEDRAAVSGRIIKSYNLTIE